MDTHFVHPPKYMDPQTSGYKVTVDHDIDDLEFEIEPLRRSPRHGNGRCGTTRTWTASDPALEQPSFGHEQKAIDVLIAEPERLHLSNSVVVTRNARAFTLVELLVVIAIIGIRSRRCRPFKRARSGPAHTVPEQSQADWPGVP